MDFNLAPVLYEFSIRFSGFWVVASVSTIFSLLSSDHLEKKTFPNHYSKIFISFFPHSSFTHPLFFPHSSFIHPFCFCLFYPPPPIFPISSSIPPHFHPAILPRAFHRHWNPNFSISCWFKIDILSLLNTELPDFHNLPPVYTQLPIKQSKSP